MSWGHGAVQRALLAKLRKQQLATFLTDPPLSGGGRWYAPDPISKKKKEKSDGKDFFLSNRDCEERSFISQCNVAVALISIT
jgi:hypothetical protein